VKTAFFLLIAAGAFAQAPQADTKQRARTVHDLAKQGQDAIPQIAPYLSDPDLSVRIEAVKSLVEIGGPKTVDALVRAAGDNDPEVQIRAGMSGTLQRAGNAVRGKFTEVNDQIIDAYVQVRPDVITALGKLARGGSSLESRGNACRAIGVLRGRAAIPDLAEALHSKDNNVMYEALIAVQKIRDPSSAGRIAFLLKDLDDRIQITALETTGILGNREAAPDVRDAMEHARNVKIRRAAVSALAMLADPADHAIFLSYLTDKDDGLRGAASEGIGRLKNPIDRPTVEKLFNEEKRMNPRLSDAFALVSLGNLDTSEFSPLRYLVNSLNQKLYRSVASAYLTELARDERVRQAIYPLLTRATKDEKIQMSIVLARSGDRDSVPFLEAMSTDTDTDVAQEGIRSLRTLRQRLP
jgi:HEAT repeat protein